MAGFVNPSWDHDEEPIHGYKPGPWDGYSRLDRLDGLGEPLPEPMPATRHAAACNCDSQPVRPSRRASLWLAAVLLLMLAVFAAGWFWITGGVL